MLRGQEELQKSDQIEPVLQTRAVCVFTESFKCGKVRVLLNLFRPTHTG